jgi:hypothetical protein
MSDILKVTILFNVFQVFLSTGLEKYRYHGNGVPTFFNGTLFRLL